jgi:hypothetical protein
MAKNKDHKEPPKGEDCPKEGEQPSEEYQRFEDAVRTILTVPKADVDRAMKGKQSGQTGGRSSGATKPKKKR